METEITLRHCVCLGKARRMVYILTFRGQLENLTSGQGQVVTQVGHIAYWETRLDETNTLASVSFLYLEYIASYCPISDGDL